MKLSTSLAIIIALGIAGCGGGGSPSTTAQSITTATPSISQLQREVAAQHEIAEDYLRQTMQITREARIKGEEYRSDEAHQEAASLIRHSQKARQRAAALHDQMCELVLEDPRTPQSDRLGMIALKCE